MEIHCLDLHLAFDKLYWCPVVKKRKERNVNKINISQPKTRLKKREEKKTNKTKLVKNPAPPAASPSCGIVRGSVVEENVQMTFWNAEYARKSGAAFAIEPTIGADNP